MSSNLASMESGKAKKPVMQVTAEEYSLLYNVYLMAERFSQARCTEGDIHKAEFDLNVALCDYESWSENEPRELRQNRLRPFRRKSRRKRASKSLNQN